MSAFVESCAAETYMYFTADDYDAGSGFIDPLNAGGLNNAEWELSHASQVGAVHLQNGSENQDFALTSLLPSGGIFAAVADGVGQGARGDVAAKALVEHWLATRLIPSDTENKVIPDIDWLERSDKVVAAALARVATEPGAATGAALWFESGGRGFGTRVGDCRIYVIRFRDGYIDSVERPFNDQTYYELGETAPSIELEHQPSRMVGSGCAGDPELVELFLARGDAVLICSDGVHGPNEASKGDDWIRGSFECLINQDALANLPEQLVSKVPLIGGKDDATAVLIRRK
jgi:serine/threonine protein phosphatase PrpC